MRQRILALVVCLGAFSTRVNAETLTFHYTGIIDTFYGDVTPIAAWLGYAPVLGDRLDALYTFDSNAVDELPADSHIGNYALISISMSVGPATVSLDPRRITVLDNCFFCAEQEWDYVVDSYWVRGQTVSDEYRFGGEIYMAKLSGLPSGPFDSDALPLVPPSPGSFDQPVTFISLNVRPASGPMPVHPPVCPCILAHDVAIVPIASAGWLLAPAFGVLSMRRRRAAA